MHDDHRLLRDAYNQLTAELQSIEEAMLREAAERFDLGQLSVSTALRFYATRLLQARRNADAADQRIVLSPER